MGAEGEEGPRVTNVRTVDGDGPRVGSRGWVTTVRTVRDVPCRSRGSPSGPSFLSDRVPRVVPATSHSAPKTTRGFRISPGPRPPTSDPRGFPVSSFGGVGRTPSVIRDGGGDDF